MVTLLDELDDAQVTFRSATEPFDTATPVGRMVIQLLGVFAEFEREVIIDRVINGMERKAAKGKWLGGPRPYGYRHDPQTDALVPDQTEAAVIKRVFDLYTRRGGLRGWSDRHQVEAVEQGRDDRRPLRARVRDQREAIKDDTVLDSGEDARLGHADQRGPGALLRRRGQDRPQQGGRAKHLDHRAATQATIWQ
jgi:DNA invertase Pin-like site-specific DNA recombinase